MRLERIDIRRLPGIHPGFRIDDLSAGVNFITGPNASGKSSIIRALRYLLSEPRSGDPAGLDLLARFVVEDQTWQVRREGTRLEWEIDGRPADRPALPDRDSLGCYLITVEDLFRLQGGSERALAEQLRREIHQNFDLAVLREEKYRLQPRIGQSEQRALQQQNAELRQIEAGQREVHEQEKRLPELTGKIEQARAAGRQQRQLEQALALAETRRKLAGLETRLNGFPEGMERLTGRELDRLAELEERSETLAGNLKEQQQQRDSAAEALRRSGLPPAHSNEQSRPDEEALSIQQKRISELETLDRQVQDRRDEVSEAEVRLNAARARLQPHGTDAERMPAPDPDNLRRARELAEQLDAREQRMRELESRLDEHDETIDENELDRHQRAMHLLQDWLSAPRTGTAMPTLPLALAAVGAVVAVAGGLLETGLPAIAGGALMLLAVLMLVLKKGRGSQAGGNRARQTLEEQLQALDVQGPEEWTRPAVQQRLNTLGDELARMRLAWQRRQRGEEIRRELAQVESQRDVLNEQIRQLAEQIGFDPRLTTRALVQFVELLGDFHQARLALEQANSRVGELQARRAGLLGEIQPFLARWLDEKSADPVRTDQLDAALRRLSRQCRQAQEAEAQLHQCERDIERLEGEREDNRKAIEKLYREAGLEPGQRRELESRLARLEDWQELRQEIRTAQDNAAVLENELESRPDLLEPARADDFDAIQSQLDQSREQAERLEELLKEKADIEATIQQTGRDLAREKALAGVAQARDQLEDIRARVIETELAHFLLTEIESEYRKEKQPALLTRAREAFRTFTHNQWDLEFIESDPIGFQARDLVLAERRGLDELSTATRMQLLLALRMGRILAREQSGPNLPLILDEALTNSDFERATVIIGNLQQLAEDQHRQILYLAAGDYEYRLWQQATGTAPKHIDLARIRQQPARSQPQFELPERDAVPPPGDSDAQAYARRLGVPAIDPRAPAEAVHIFHLLPDRLELLHALIDQWRITRLGQLESLLQSAAADHAISDEETRRQLQQRCRIIRDWIDAWRIGRGKPVDRAALEQAIGEGGLSDNTVNGVAEMAKAVAGDPDRLLQTLENDPIRMESGTERRLSAPQLEKFRDYLSTEGYLGDRQPLTPEQRRQRLLHQHGSNTPAERIHQQIDWLEAAL
ncbi:MAG: AAA family ATPase, partial [Wenzhouxiangellaceae bacterium]